MTHDPSHTDQTAEVQPSSATRTPDHTRRSLLAKLGAGVAALSVGQLLPGALAQNAATQSAGKAWPAGLSLDVAFTVATKATGRVKRPYVAVWIEDAQGKTIRNLTVWVQQNRLNPRWLAELRRWTRENSGLVSTVSSATRNPGSYAVAWDGKTARGTAAPQGDYYVCVESAREHGPYGLVRQKVTLGASAFQKDLGSSGDIEAVRVSFGKA